MRTASRTGRTPLAAGAALGLVLLLGAGCGGEDGPGVTGPPAKGDPPAPAGDSAPAPGQAPIPAPVAGVPDAAARLASYDRGLAYLRSQARDGKWGPPGGAPADPGITALVITAFLDRPGGIAPGDGDLVAEALDWLRSHQKPDGGIYDRGVATYTTSLAVEALTRAAAKGGKPAGNTAADAEVLAKAVAFLRKMQFFEGGGEGRVVDRSDIRYGGLGYGSDPTQPDLSNTQFALESLRAAGIPEDDPAFQRALVYLQRTQNRKENETAGEPTERPGADGKVLVRSSDGGANYRPFDSKAGTVERPDGRLETRSYGSMTYALLKCYIFAGLTVDDPRVRDALAWLGKNYTWEENPGFETPELARQGLYYYYATAARALALAGAGATGGKGIPDTWRDDLAARLLELQRENGAWVNEVDRWMEGLPEVATAFALKALAETVPGK